MHVGQHRRFGFLLMDRAVPNSAEDRLGLAVQLVATLSEVPSSLELAECM